MDVLWGYKHYGKSYITGLYRYNRKNVTIMQIGGMYLSCKWMYDELDQQRIKYYRYKDEDIITTDIKTDRLSSDDLLHHDTDKGIRNMGFVEEDYLGYGKNSREGWLKRKKLRPDCSMKPNLSKLESRELYPIYSDHGSIWEDHFFNDLCDCDLFVPRPHPQLMSYKPFIEHFKKCRNIFSYKSDIVDICIARINLFESEETNKHMNTNINDVEDAYHTDKELVFSHLDFFVTNNRNVEQQLIDLDIPYEYLDLDTHDYKVLCDNPVSRKHGEQLEYTPRDSERYKFARYMVEDYIKTRGLTDLRLSGRIHDKI